MSHNSEDLLENIKRQAKRLAKLLSCQLGQAQETLAICVYGCKNYSQLLTQIHSHSFENPQLALAALTPNSEIFLLKLLASHLGRITGNFEKKFPGSQIKNEELVTLFGLSFEEFKIKISNQ